MVLLEEEEIFFFQAETCTEFNCCDKWKCILEQICWWKLNENFHWFSRMITKYIIIRKYIIFHSNYFKILDWIPWNHFTGFLYASFKYFLLNYTWLFFSFEVLSDKILIRSFHRKFLLKQLFAFAYFTRILSKIFKWFLSEIWVT